MLAKSNVFYQSVDDLNDKPRHFRGSCILPCMETQTKTLSVRIRDQHATLLRTLAFEVNQVWNAANAESAAFSRVPISGVGWIHGETSVFALQKSLQPLRADEHGKKRRQFKTDKLRFISSQL